MPGAPVVPVAGEVAHAGLLVLLHRPEQRVLLDTGVGLDGGDRVLAVAGVVPVHHREHGVGPVVVRRPLVAVAHEREPGHLRADVVELLLGHRPHAHRVGLVAGAAVVHHRGEAPHQLAVLERLQHLQQRGLVGPDRLGLDREGALHEREVLLHDADRLDLERRQVGRLHDRLALGALVLEHLGLGVGGGLAGHVELDADLVELERRQHPRDVRARLPVQHVDVGLEVVARRHGDRVPEVVGVVALVVVAHAGMPADHGRGLVDPVGVDLGRDQRGAVAERPGVEDGRELAQDTQLLHPGEAGHHVVLGDAEPLREHRVGPRIEREVPLDRVQQLPVEILEVVEAQLAHRSHRGGRRRKRQITSPGRPSGWSRRRPGRPAGHAAPRRRCGDRRPGRR